MLTGIPTNHLADTSPWGQLCSDETWPIAEFEPAVSACQAASAGLIPWSIGFSTGLSSDTLGCMHPTVFAYLQASEASLRYALTPNMGQGGAPGLVIAADDLLVLESILRESLSERDGATNVSFCVTVLGVLLLMEYTGPWHSSAACFGLWAFYLPLCS